MASPTGEVQQGHAPSVPKGLHRPLSPLERDRLMEQARRGSYRPDLLVVLVKSRIGSSWRQKRILDSLGLRRPGKAVLGPLDGWFVGQVAKVDHLVNIYTLSSDGSLPIGSRDAMTDLQRAARRDQAGYRLLANGEYVEWSKNSRSTSLIWSSELDLTDLILAVDAVLGDASQEQRGLVDFDGVQSTPTAAHRARQLALDNPRAVTFLRLEYAPGVAFVWTPTPGTMELERKSHYAEASVIFAHDSVELAARMMARTATRNFAPVAVRISEALVSE